MRPIRELLSELDIAAERTLNAQEAYANAVLEALKAEQRLKDYEADVRAAAANKELHPELTNKDLRDGFVSLKMGSDLGENYYSMHLETLYEKLMAQAKYDYCRRRGNDLRIIVSALKPEG